MTSHMTFSTCMVFLWEMASTAGFMLQCLRRNARRKHLVFSRAFSRSVQLCTQSSEKATEPFTIRRDKNGVRTIYLNDQKRRNALSLCMLESLHADLTAEDDALRVIVLTANGPVFSAGHDLKELTSREGRDYHAQVFHTCTQVMSLLQELPVPVIAQVKGLATAAGCQLVASCDIAIATDTSRFATPGVNVGLFCTTPGVAVARSVPSKVAMEMLFTGEPISAQDALLHGLISRVVPENRIEEETERITEKICSTSKSVVALGKTSYYRQIKMDRPSAYKFAEKVMVDNLAFRDGQEGIKAFVEKRKPSWSHDDKTVH